MPAKKYYNITMKFHNDQCLLQFVHHLSNCLEMFDKRMLHTFKHYGSVFSLLFDDLTSYVYQLDGQTARLRERLTFLA